MKKVLTQRQRNEIRCKLVSLQVVLSSSIVETSKKFLNNICFDHPAYGNHPADVTHEIPVMEEYKAGRLIEKLRQIDAALKRIDSNEFGTCIDCRRKIPFKRFQTVPTCLRCVLCEEENEVKNSRHYRVSMAL